MADTNFSEWYFAGRREQMKTLKSLLAACEKGTSQLVVLRNDPSKMEDSEQNSGHQHGRGTGKSRVLHEFGRYLVDQGTVAVELMQFVDLRRKLSVTNFTELFCQQFFSKHSKMAFRDLWLLLQYVAGRFLVVLCLMSVITILGLYVASAFVQAAVGIEAGAPRAIYNWAIQNNMVIIAVGVAAFAVTFWYFWYSSADAAKTRWAAFPAPRSRRDADIRSNDKHRVSELISSHFKTHQTYVILVDDLDSIGNIAYDILMTTFYALAEKGARVMLVTAYDPFNAVLRREGEWIISSLEAPLSASSNWRKTLIDLPPLNEDDINLILSQRYSTQSQQAQEILEELQGCEVPPEIDFAQDANTAGARAVATRADIIFGFFSFLEDEQYITPGPPVRSSSRRHTWRFEGIQVPELFPQYLGRDTLIVRQLLEKLDSMPSKVVSGNCREILKYMLVFRRPVVKAKHLLKLLGISQDDFTASTQELIALGVLTLRDQGLSFASVDWRIALETSMWSIWNVDGKYSTQVFEWLLKKSNINEQPNIDRQALDSRPSLAALDILIKKADYLFLDLGYTNEALRLYAGKNGALEKWLWLLRTNGPAATPVGGLVEWASKDVTPYNPAHVVATKYLHRPVRPLDLCTRSGQLYMVLGYLPKAEQVWTESWAMARERLLDLAETSATSDLAETEATITADLAELRFLEGRWAEAEAEALSGGGVSRPSNANAIRIGFVKLLIEYYRLRGIAQGDEVAGRRYLTSQTYDLLTSLRGNISDLLKSSEDANLDIVELLCRFALLLREDGRADEAVSWSDRALNLISKVDQARLSRLQDGDLLRYLGIICYFSRNEASRLRGATSWQCYTTDHEGEDELLDEFDNIFGVSRFKERVTDPATGEMIVRPRSDEAITKEQLSSIHTAIDDAAKYAKLWLASPLQTHNKLAPPLARLAEIAARGEAEIRKLSRSPLKQRRSAANFFAVQVREDLTKAYTIIGDYMPELSLEFIRKASQQYSLLNCRSRLAEMQYLMGVMYKSYSEQHADPQRQEEYKAMWAPAYEKSLEMRHNMGITYRRAEMYLELARASTKLGHHPRAAEYHVRCAELCQALGLPAFLYASLMAVAGLFYYNTNSIKDSKYKARECCEKAVATFLSISADELGSSANLEFEILHTRSMLIQLLRLTGEPNTAVKVCNELLEATAGKTKWYGIRCDTLIQHGDLLIQLQGIDGQPQAIEVYQECLELATEQNEEFWRFLAAKKLLTTWRWMKAATSEPVDITAASEAVQKYKKLLEELYSKAKTEEYHTKSGAWALSMSQAANELANHGETKADKLELYEEALEYCLQIGEYHPAWENLESILGLWDASTQDLSKLSKWLWRMLAAVDIDADNSLAMETLNGIYHLQKLMQGDSYPPSRAGRVQVFRQAQKIFEDEKPKLAIKLLEKSWRQIIEEAQAGGDRTTPYEPLDSDIAIADLLYNCYLAVERHEDAKTILLHSRVLKGIRTSAMCYFLGQGYELTRPDIALHLYKRGGKQRPDNNFALLCRRRWEFLVQKMPVSEVEQISVLATISQTAS